MTQSPRLLVVGATGWYGKTLVFEYVLSHGPSAARKNLRLYASKSTSLRLDLSNQSLSFPVRPLSEIAYERFEDYDGLVWYAFLLKTKLLEIGSKAYRSVNDEIASLVFTCLALNPHLKVAFFSSGVAFGINSTPSYEADPYVYLKILYQRQLSEMVPLLTVYPFATLGRFVPDHRTFAAASFIYQAKRFGRITLESRGSVVRSYGSVHDFSRLILEIYGSSSSFSSKSADSLVPVSHTLDLFQLAHEVFYALDQEVDLSCSLDCNCEPSVYVSPDYSYNSQLAAFGLSPTVLSSQLKDMSTGDAFDV